MFKEQPHVHGWAMTNNRLIDLCEVTAASNLFVFLPCISWFSLVEDADGTSCFLISLNMEHTCLLWSISLPVVLWKYCKFWWIYKLRFKLQCEALTCLQLCDCPHKRSPVAHNSIREGKELEPRTSGCLQAVPGVSPSIGGREVRIGFFNVSPALIVNTLSGSVSCFFHWDSQ